jgi:hypothetical protein
VQASDRAHLVDFWVVLETVAHAGRQQRHQLQHLQQLLLWAGVVGIWERRRCVAGAGCQVRGQALGNLARGAGAPGKANVRPLARL